MQVAGIDPSLSGAAVTILSGARHLPPKHLQTLKLASKPCGSDIRARISRYKAHASDIAAHAKHCPVIAIEHYSFGSLGRREDLAEFGGLLRYKLLDNELGGVKVYEIPPTVLKKWAAGKGSGDKTALIAAIARRYDVQFASNDEYDSFALAQLAMQLAGLSEPETAYQRECVDKILNPVKKTKKRKAG